jgi:hypothetical protein
MNRELIEVENIRNKKEGVTETDDQSDDDEFFNL